MQLIKKQNGIINTLKNNIKEITKKKYYKFNKIFIK